MQTKKLIKHIKYTKKRRWGRKQTTTKCDLVVKMRSSSCYIRTKWRRKLWKKPKKNIKNCKNCIGVCVPFVYIAGAPLKVTASRPWRPAGKGSSGLEGSSGGAGFVYQHYESSHPIILTSQLQRLLLQEPICSPRGRTRSEQIEHRATYNALSSPHCICSSTQPAGRTVCGRGACLHPLLVLQAGMQHVHTQHPWCACGKPHIVCPVTCASLLYPARPSPVGRVAGALHGASTKNNHRDV